ncbi:isocitrate lyase/phosphoenolpyruvate mutase family protein [Jatrophihabitans sp.]|uniref:isocitrate lyase/PEP mutase family protein n=1 Tax=Jatrophihabitans sp. TaxID=1932789 RepID=UPI0030C75712|nr:carboxyvinyl-carboxyphosphonate phosphorylmutase [Jatrophihabitans sp.]
MGIGSQLRHLLSQPGMLRIPGVHDGYSARAAEVMGFGAVYIGGGVGIGPNLGLPDMGVMQSSHLIAAAGRLAQLVDIPVIADLDDGGGHVLRVRQAVTDAERAGIAGVHIEDSDFSAGRHFPSATQGGGGHLNFSDDRVIGFDAAVERFKAALSGRRDPDTVIIGRTDAALHSFDEAIRRGRAFADLGADVVFLAHLAPEQVRLAVEAIPAPLMNCVLDPAGASPAACTAMEQDGLKILFDHRAVPLAAYQAEWAALERFRDQGDIAPDLPGTRVQLAQVIRHAEWAEIARDHRTATDQTH